MKDLQRRGGLFFGEAGQVVEVVGVRAEELLCIDFDELEELVKLGVAEVAPLVRTGQMVAEYRHYRASHQVELRPGAVALLEAWERHQIMAGAWEQELEELKAEKMENARLHREVEGLEKLLAAKRRTQRSLEAQLERWGPSFELAGVPIFLVDYDGGMNGTRASPSEETARERARVYLAQEATFRPSSEEAVVGHYCHATKRVAWEMRVGLVVVDDYGPSLAVHVVRTVELAKAMVSKEITIAEARRRPEHLVRIKHEDGYEEKVRKALREYT